MKVLETFLVIIIFLVALCIILFIPNYQAASNKGFGEWRLRNTGVCENLKRTDIWECIPNSITSRGCLLKDLSFETLPNHTQVWSMILREEDCIQQINSSRWEKIDTSPCEIHQNSPFPDENTIKLTYECVSTGIKGGLNACEYFDYTFYGGALGTGTIPTWTLANVGESYNYYLPCKSVLTEQKIEVDGKPSITYTSLNDCLVSNNQTLNDSLREGMTDKGGLCRYLPYPPSNEGTFTGTIEEIATGFGILVNETGEYTSVGTLNLPSNSGIVSIPGINLLNPNVKNNVITPLNIIPLITFTPSATLKCSKENITLVSSTKWVFAPRKNLGNNTYEVIVGLLLDSGIPGWLGYSQINSLNQLQWISARMIKDGPGVLSNDAPVFHFYIHGSGVDNVFSPGTGVKGWIDFSLKTTNGDDLYISDKFQTAVTLLEDFKMYVFPSNSSQFETWNQECNINRPTLRS